MFDLAGDIANLQRALLNVDEQINAALDQGDQNAFQTWFKQRSVHVRRLEELIATSLHPSGAQQAA